MHLKSIIGSGVLLILLARLCMPLFAETVFYDCTGSDYFYANGVSWALDDGSFATGTAPVQADSVYIAFFTTGYTMVDADVAIEFWDHYSPNSYPCNSGSLGTIYYQLRNLYPNWFYSYLLQPSVPISFYDDDWMVEIVFIDPYTGLLSDKVRIAFANGAVLPMGASNQDVFWLDDNYDMKFADPEERYGFTPPDKSQFYLKLASSNITKTPFTGTVVFRGWRGSSLPNCLVSIDGSPYQAVSINPLNGAAGQFNMQLINGLHQISIKAEKFLSESKWVLLQDESVSELFSWYDGLGLPAGDANNDNQIDEADLWIITSFLGSAGNPSDLDGDGMVDDFDVLLTAEGLGFIGN